MSPRLEFRIPVAPTPAFYSRVHFFCAALRRLGSAYADSLVRVVVGNNADLNQVRRQNQWSTQYNVEWHVVPCELSFAHSYYGTSDFRYLLPESAADLVVLSDADTVVVSPVAEHFAWMLCDQAAIAGHMAHVPPPIRLHESQSPWPRDFWPILFHEFSIPYPTELFRYSKDLAGQFPLAPAYYNLGFVVLNRAGLQNLKNAVSDTRARLNELVDSEMRCQIAVTLMAYRHAFIRQNLSAIFNAANDEAHLRHNSVRPEGIKVLHYLRTGELNRDTFLLGEGRSRFLTAKFKNPANQLLQKLGREIFSENGNLNVNNR